MGGEGEIRVKVLAQSLLRFVGGSSKYNDSLQTSCFFSSMPDYCMRAVRGDATRVAAALTFEESAGKSKIARQESAATLRSMRTDFVMLMGSRIFVELVDASSGCLLHRLSKHALHAEVLHLLSRQSVKGTQGVPFTDLLVICWMHPTDPPWVHPTDPPKEIGHVS
jgi:hypothetical protein